MDFSILFYVWVFVILGLIIYSWVFGDEIVIKRKLSRTILRKIKEAKEGEMVKIKGTITLLGDYYDAPISGRRCAYYNLIVDRYIKLGSVSGTWQNVNKEEMIGDVILYDGENYAIVDTDYMKSFISKEVKYSSGPFQEANNQIKSSVELMGFEITSIFYSKKEMRYSEGVLEENETVTVAGKAKWLKKDEIQFEIDKEEVLYIVSDKDNPVYLSDDEEVNS